MGNTLFLLSVFFLSLLLMDTLRVGSLNVNGMRDRKKAGNIIEFIRLKNLDVIFLQETHSDMNNEVDWRLWWGNECVLTHGTNLSAGAAILFSPTTKVRILSKKEIEPGRLLAVRADINGLFFVFVNIYAPNIGSDRINIFNKLKIFLKQQQVNDLIILGGDWNCTLDPSLDRNGEEPNFQSPTVLANIVKISNFTDSWRENNPMVKQYTWVKVNEGRISAARLDRLYLSNNMKNRVVHTAIIPTYFTDHKLITVDCTLISRRNKRSYWHFNVKLLQDKFFCESFKHFWETWKSEKCRYENIILWWEIGKTHIREYCQQYTSYSTLCLKRTLEGIEKEILVIEENMMRDLDAYVQEWSDKKLKLSSVLNEKVKGALVRSRFMLLKDMDGPTSFFFNLEHKSVQENKMLSLKNSNGHDTSDPVEMRRLAVDFYSKLYSAENTDEKSQNELLQNLPCLNAEDKKTLESELTFGELSAAVSGLASGRTPGIDGLPGEFYKHFWTLIGTDFHEVLKEVFRIGLMPKSCQRAVLTLLPKKGDLTLIKNWRPVALLCSEYKLISKCLANRLNKIMHRIIHKDQSYCIKDRCITDNLHLVRDVIDYALENNVDIGILSLDQEKAFDRVDHQFLFKVLKAFGFGDKFVSLIKLLYNNATCMIKMAGGLSVPVKVQRGIRQGCPLSGQLYSLVIEPLLCKLREKLTGLQTNVLNCNDCVKISAYADDITVVLRNGYDVQVLKDILLSYGKASSAKVNWDKSDALWCGVDYNGPQLPARLQWGRAGLKYLGVFLGREEYKKQNWEGLMEKVSARLSHWHWLLPQLSYRGRVLVCNNLVASSLWHKMTVLEPPEELVESVQKRLVNFFWSGQHWLRASALYLPRQEGGQGLVDIRSRIKTFRLQTAKRLLYGKDVSWTGVACALLRKAGNMGLDRHFFLMDTQGMDLSGLTPFYQSMLKAWKILNVSRNLQDVRGLWMREEPLLYNPVVDLDNLKSSTMRTVLRNVGITKIGHLITTNEWMSAEMLAAKLGVRSIRLTQRLLNELFERLPTDFKRGLETSNEDIDVPFPELKIAPAFNAFQEREGILLTFKTPEMELFSETGKKALYVTCVKVSHMNSLEGLKESKWQEDFGPGTSPKRSWGTLYKPPIEKRCGDLQWRIVHGLIATNRYRAHIDPQVGEECLFCGQTETVLHLFFYCGRLEALLSQIEEWCRNLGEVFSPVLFIYGPMYKKNRKQIHVMLNFLFGQAKMAIWLSRKGKLNGVGSTDAVAILKGLVKSRLTVEHAYYQLIKDIETFKYTWGVEKCLCEIDIDGSLQINF